MEFLSAKREEQGKTKAESECLYLLTCSLCSMAISRRTDPPTKIQDQWEIPQVILLNAIVEEELKWPDFSWLNRTYGGIGKID